MKEIINQVQQAIFLAIDESRLTLPTMPEVALKVREASTEADVSIINLAKVIGEDPALSARIIKVSNSPLLRGTDQILDINMAVSRLGVEYTSNLATGLAMEQMFQATSDLIDSYLRSVWSHSMEIASLSTVIARHYTNLKPDQAMLAGLTHQIGILPILTYAEYDRKILKDPELLKGIIKQCHSAIGVKILKAWDFSENLRNVPIEYRNYQREVPAADYADVVMVASLENRKIKPEALQKISAYQRLGFGYKSSIEEDENLSQEMEMAMAMLDPNQNQ